MVARTEQQGKRIFQWGEKFVDIGTLEKVVTRRFSIWDALLCASALRRRTAHLLSNGTREMYQGYRSATLKTVMEEVEYR